MTKPKAAMDQSFEIHEPGTTTTKEITIDTLRGLYWMATEEHVGAKSQSGLKTKEQLKKKLSDLLLTKEGMRMFLKSLEKFVFS